ncbi:MAG: hypothetical protein DSO07_07160 [Thermoproteota archaeon]|jgi:hypothetical protein|uniref:DUF8045 domain-containing protein n=1 Tax=Candidatus Methanodesulfokora washburnensis TaxID=2478471 RepID=A0A3R9PFD6_9CREN|nr:hypothetical protein [Candidatus Methanodesulfokores washburnensis]RSN71486.1 hypothetical protein D6D85_15900 [Candidatus Methanodesulfokores washburnensis]RZN61972.1 MAG: hypothetical protein EF810_03915 [Candidatus Methanodesulfokores washburnensis]TDA40943.1 MAG: hypothetical protein DSO07_07160 [Candidatus Korarchaeota archaeon]
MIKIRYYADDYDKQRHERKIELLNEIYNRHGIPVEITRVDPRHSPLPKFQGSIEEISEENAWKRDFSRNKDLSRNLGEAPSRVFKTRSGNLAISSAVGVVVDGILQWAALYDDGLNFLQRVLDLGESAIKEVYTSREEAKDLHEKVVREFAEAGVIPGNPKFGVIVGELSESELAKYDWDWRNFARRMVEKEIDLVMENPDRDWIIEVKPEFTSDNVEKGLGQLMLYEYLYRIKNPQKKIEKALVFAKVKITGTKFDYGKEESLKQMIEALRYYGINVWLRYGEKQFYKLT